VSDPSSSDGQPGFLDKLEEALTQTAVFAGRFLRTLWLAGVKPWQLAANPLSGGLARPYTFLAVCALAGIRGMRRVALFFMLVASVPWSCNSRNDTIVTPALPPLATEFAAPSAGELIFIALPLVICLLGASRVFRRLVRASASAAESTLASACYAVGLQQVAFVVTSLVFVVWATPVLLPASGAGGVEVPNWVWPALTVLLGLAWPAWLLIAHLRAIDDSPGVFVWAGYVGAVALFLGTTFIISLAIAGPLAMAEWQHIRHPRPLLTIVPVRLERQGDSVLNAAVLVSNTSYTRRVVRADSVEIVVGGTAGGRRIFHGAFEKWNGQSGPVYAIDSGATAWASGDFRLTEEGWPPLVNESDLEGSHYLSDGAVFQVVVRDLTEGATAREIVSNYPATRPIGEQSSFGWLTRVPR
jgi:hypothetical protein